MNFIFKNLGLKNKILFVLASVLLLVFSVNLTIIKIRNNQVKEEQTYINLTKLITQKQNQAEANLLYSNEEGVRQLFTEIQGLISTFPQETDEQKKQYQEFMQKFNEQLAKTRKAISVDNLQEIGNLLNLNSAAKPDSLILAPNKNFIYVSDNASQALYLIDPTNNLITTQAELNNQINKLQFPMLGKNNNIYYLNGDNILEIDPAKNTARNLNIKFGFAATDIAAADIYNNNLYVVNSKNNQIYRYEKLTNSFATARSWLKETLELKNIIDLAIDGQIYLLTSNGEVTKLFKGKKVDFKIDIVDPPLVSPTKILTFEENNYLYIMEPVNQRLLVFEKNGQFIAQYQTNKFTDLKDFTVDEKNKVVYVLNGTSLLKFEAAHLKK